MCSPRAVWTDSRSTRRIAWPGNMRIKSCWSMSAAAPVSRSFSSTAPWGKAQKMTGCCRCKA